MEMVSAILMPVAGAFAPEFDGLGFVEAVREWEAMEEVVV